VTILFFLQDSAGHWGFSGGLLRPLDAVLLVDAISHSHSLPALGAFWEAYCGHWIAVLLVDGISHSHSLWALGDFWRPIAAIGMLFYW